MNGDAVVVADVEKAGGLHIIFNNAVIASHLQQRLMSSCRSSILTGMSLAWRRLDLPHTKGWYLLSQVASAMS